MGKELHKRYVLIFSLLTKLTFVFSQSLEQKYPEVQRRIQEINKTTFIGRYYFKKNKLIDLETTGHNRFEDDALDPESVLLNEMKGLLAILRKKKK